jgi:hypothetical protein
MNGVGRSDGFAKVLSVSFVPVLLFSFVIFFVGSCILLEENKKKREQGEHG